MIFRGLFFSRNAEIGQVSEPARLRGQGPRQKINTPSGLSFGPSAALHPPAHIH